MAAGKIKISFRQDAGEDGGEQTGVRRLTRDWKNPIWNWINLQGHKYFKAVVQVCFGLAEAAEPVSETQMSRRDVASLGFSQ